MLTWGWSMLLVSSLYGSHFFFLYCSKNLPIFEIFKGAALDSLILSLYLSSISLISSLLWFHQIRSDQSLCRVRLFATPWIAARQASLSITNSRSSPRLTSIESVMPSSHLILCRPLLLLPQSLPASESFPMSQLFASGGQTTGVSALASFLPKNTHDWFMRVLFTVHYFCFSANFLLVFGSLV